MLMTRLAVTQLFFMIGGIAGMGDGKILTNKKRQRGIRAEEANALLAQTVPHALSA
jgi:hypothetical protein